MARLRVRQRRRRLRLAIFVRGYRTPTTAQILAIGFLRRGKPLPDELLAALCTSEMELELAGVIFGSRSPASATGSQPR